VFEDKALADDVAAIVEKQIHFGGEDPTKQEVKHLEDTTTQAEPRNVVWLVACNDAIPASSGNDIQVPVVGRKLAFLRNKWYISIPYGGGWDVINFARTMFCFQWEKGQDVSFK
jgi:hypothetical protein